MADKPIQINPKRDPLDEAIPLDEIEDDVGTVRKNSSRNEIDGNDFHKEFSDAIYDENELPAQEVGLGLGLAEDETDEFEGTTLLGGAFMDEPDTVRLSNTGKPFASDVKKKKKKKSEDDDDLDEEDEDEDLIDLDEDEEDLEDDVK